MDRVLNTLLDHIFFITNSETALVLLYEDEMRSRLQVCRGYEEWQKQSECSSITSKGNNDSLVQRLKESRRSVTIPNLEFFPSTEGMARVGSIHSWLVVPIFASETIIGLVELGLEREEVLPPD